MELQNNNPNINISLDIKNLYVKNYVQSLINKYRYVKCLLFKGNKIISLKNEFNDCAVISFIDGGLHVYNNNSDYREELNYFILGDLVNVQFSRYERVSKSNFYNEMNILEDNYFYDSNGVLVVHKLKKENIVFNNISNSFSCALSGCNYVDYLEDYVVGDKLIRISKRNYFYHDDLDTTFYYESVYEPGMFSSLDNTKVVKPRFVLINEDVFNEKYKDIIEKRKQKQKIVL